MADYHVQQVNHMLDVLAETSKIKNKAERKAAAEHNAEQIIEYMNTYIKAKPHPTLLPRLEEIWNVLNDSATTEDHKMSVSTDMINKLLEDCLNGEV